MQVTVDKLFPCEHHHSGYIEVIALITASSNGKDTREEKTGLKN